MGFLLGTVLSLVKPWIILRQVAERHNDAYYNTWTLAYRNSWMKVTGTYQDGPYETKSAATFAATIVEEEIAKGSNEKQ